MSDYWVIERISTLGKSMLAQTEMSVVFVLNKKISLGALLKSDGEEMEFKGQSICKVPQ